MTLILAIIALVLGVVSIVDAPRSRIWAGLAIVAVALALIL